MLDLDGRPLTETGWVTVELSALGAWAPGFTGDLDRKDCEVLFQPLVDRVPWSLAAVEQALHAEIEQTEHTLEGRVGSTVHPNVNKRTRYRLKLTPAPGQIIFNEFPDSGLSLSVSIPSEAGNVAVNWKVTEAYLTSIREL